MDAHLDQVRQSHIWLRDGTTGGLKKWCGGSLTAQTQCRSGTMFCGRQVLHRSHQDNGNVSYWGIVCTMTYFLSPATANLSLYHRKEAVLASVSQT